MTIHEVSLQIKGVIERFNSREVYTVFLILLVGFCSFGLGRLSKLEESRLPIQLESALAETASAAVAPSVVSPSSEATVPLVSGGQLVASKSGEKYHFPWCSGTQRISEANKIWFNSIEEARKAGYTPASNCKGLK